MAAVLGDHGFKFDAHFVFQPLVADHHVVGKLLRLVHVVEPQAGSNGIFHPKIKAVLDSCGFLLGCADSCHFAAVDDGVSAEGRHLFEHDDRFAGFGGLVSGGKPANPEPITITSVVSSYFAGALTGLACAAPSPAVPISAAAVPSMLRREMLGIKFSLAVVAWNEIFRESCVAEGLKSLHCFRSLAGESMCGVSRDIWTMSTGTSAGR